MAKWIFGPTQMLKRTDPGKKKILILVFENIRGNKMAIVWKFGTHLSLN